MKIQVTVKNTFVEFADVGADRRTRRRSSSVPSTGVPRGGFVHILQLAPGFSLTLRHDSTGLTTIAQEASHSGPSQQQEACSVTRAPPRGVFITSMQEASLGTASQHLQATALQSNRPDEGGFAPRQELPMYVGASGTDAALGSRPGVAMQNALRQRASQSDTVPSCGLLATKSPGLSPGAPQRTTDASSRSVAVAAVSDRRDCPPQAVGSPALDSHAVQNPQRATDASSRFVAAAPPSDRPPVAGSRAVANHAAQVAAFAAGPQSCAAAGAATGVVAMTPTSPPVVLYDSHASRMLARSPLPPPRVCEAGSRDVPRTCHQIATGCPWSLERNEVGQCDSPLPEPAPEEETTPNEHYDRRPGIVTDSTDCFTCQSSEFPFAPSTPSSSQGCTLRNNELIQQKLDPGRASAQHHVATSSPMRVQPSSDSVCIQTPPPAPRDARATPQKVAGRTVGRVQHFHPSSSPCVTAIAVHGQDFNPPPPPEMPPSAYFPCDLKVASHEPYQKYLWTDAPQHPRSHIPPCPSLGISAPASAPSEAVDDASHSQANHQTKAQKRRARKASSSAASSVALELDMPPGLGFESASPAHHQTTASLLVALARRGARRMQSRVLRRYSEDRIQAWVPPRRWCCFYLRMEAQGFDLVPMLIGRGGSNTRLIFELTGAKVRVRGQGSGHLEVISRQEAPTPLMLVVAAEAENQEGFFMAVERCVLLLKQIEKRYVQFCRAQELVANNPSFLFGPMSNHLYQELQRALGDLAPLRVNDCDNEFA